MTGTTSRPISLEWVNAKGARWVASASAPAAFLEAHHRTPDVYVGIMDRGELERLLQMHLEVLAAAGISDEDELWAMAP